MPFAAFFQQHADERGRFSFDSPPDTAMPVFVIAPGFALATVFLQPGEDNIIRLAFPGQPATIVLESGPPLVNFKIVAGLSGGPRVPSGATSDLAAANGLSPRDLLATQTNGASPLTSFLGPGTYDLFVDLAGGSLQWLGTLSLPAVNREVLTYRPPANDRGARD
jgi:hypothetical protein